MDRTLDIVVLVLVGGMVVMGFGSMALGWIVNRFWPENLTEDQQTGQTTQTDQTDDADHMVSDAEYWISRMRLDKTRTTLIEIMVYTEWSTSQIRAQLKGDSGATGTEAETARKRLGIEPPERTIRVRDQAGEREVIL